MHETTGSCCEQVRGLCGDFNGLVSDDMRKPTEAITHVTSDFVESWITSSECSTSDVIAINDECSINSENSVQAEEMCNRLRQGMKLSCNCVFI